MAEYKSLSPQQLRRELEALRQQYEAAQKKGLRLDMSRGKPGVTQLALSLGALDAVGSASSLKAEDGTNVCNYGAPLGLYEARRLMGEILELPPEQVIMGGNSSLNLMFDCVSQAYTHGLPGGKGPWCRQETVKFLCPVPGYDRHFAVTGHFGIEMIPVPMTESGPDMDVVEKLVAGDDAVKGIWCVPKYSNPTGYTYSDETVRRFGALSPAAGDFRIYWDNAYAVHHLYATDGKKDTLLNLMEELEKTGREDMAFLFTSTSKITFSGAGIAAVAASKTNIDCLKRRFALQTIGHDKVNQLRHVRFLRDITGIEAHMKRHEALLRPKFELVVRALSRELGPLGIASWTNPRGGYFISFDTLPGCAKRVIALCGKAGVTMTPAGATFPLGQDPEDKNVRIAPTFPDMEELREATDLFCLCVKIASLEKLT